MKRTYSITTGVFIVSFYNVPIIPQDGATNKAPQSLPIPIGRTQHTKKCSQDFVRLVPSPTNFPVLSTVYMSAYIKNTPNDNSPNNQ